MKYNYPQQWDSTQPHKIPYKPSPKDEWEKYIPKETKPKPATLADVFPNFDRWSIGLDPFFTALESIKTTKAPSYPPYNVIRTGDNYVIEMALAGFKKSDIDITVKDRTLTISSKSDLVLGEDKVKEVNKQDNVEVVHNGIASRSFTTNFALGEYIEVTEASMEDGILTIICNNIVPDEKKPKTIEIK